MAVAYIVTVKGAVPMAMQALVYKRLNCQVTEKLADGRALQTSQAFTFPMVRIRGSASLTRAVLTASVIYFFVLYSKSHVTLNNSNISTDPEIEDLPPLSYMGTVRYKQAQER